MTISEFRTLLFFVLAFFLTSCISSSPTMPPSANSSDRSTRFVKTVAELAMYFPTLELQSAQHSEFCDESELYEAIRYQGLVYQRLTRKRNLPPLSKEIENAVRLQAAVPSGTAVVFYLKAEDGHCVWLIDTDGVESFASLRSNSDTPQTLLRLFYQSQRIDAAQLKRTPKHRDSTAETLISGSTLESGVEVSTRPVLESMRQFLFPGAIFESILRYERLVIVPYDELGTFPYAAIPVSDGEALIDYASIKIAPSLVDLVGSKLGYNIPDASTVMFLEEMGLTEELVKYIGEYSLRDSFDREVVTEGFSGHPPGCFADDSSDLRSTWDGSFSALIIGDPDYSKDPEFDMPQLPGAKREAMRVSRIFDVDALIGEAATLATVEQSMTNADLLYFATHGVSYSENGLKGFLALSDGGRLTAESVQNMCLTRAQVAVLSACQTGLGQTVEGGTIGLSRAFQIAGVDDVVMSLWNVDDQATMRLMSIFSRRVRAGEEPELALRNAMLSLKRRNAAPSKWASFSVFSPEF